MSKKKYVITGTWSGYTSAQSRIVHAEVTNDKNRAEWCQNNSGILYTDNTWLILSVREVKPNERIKTYDGYGNLISKCVAQNCMKVAELKC